MHQEPEFKVIKGSGSPRAEIIEFPKGQLHEVIEFLMEKYDKGRVDNLALAYTYNDPDDEEMPKKIGSYWFGEKSCLTVSGLCDYLRGKIKDYMDEINED